MKLFNYLDNEYIKANIELQKGYEPSVKAKTMAIHVILENQKSFLKWKWYFSLLFSFAKCLVLNKWPEKVDLEAYLKDKQKQHSKDAECPPKLEVVNTTT